MLGFFITEKDTEALLEPETRPLRLPSGETRAFTAFKLFWRSFDFLTICAHYTTEELVRLAHLDCDEMGYSFEDSFPNVVAYAHRIARKKMGY